MALLGESFDGEDTLDFAGLDLEPLTEAAFGASPFSDVSTFLGLVALTVLFVRAPRMFVLALSSVGLTILTLAFPRGAISVFSPENLFTKPYGAAIPPTEAYLRQCQLFKMVIKISSQELTCSRVATGAAKECQCLENGLTMA
jgi:hypothetical protein